MRKQILIGIAFMSVAAWSRGTLAQSAAELRCAGKIVDIGVDVGYVLALCGEPAHRVATDEPIRALNPDGTSWIVGTTRTERLTYDRGSGRFPAVLTFEDGRLVRIEYDLRR